MNNLDSTLPQDLLMANQTVEIDTAEILEGIYQLSDADAYKGLNESQFADPANRAFPVNSAARCRSAMVYLVKYYNNKSSSGVTASYSDAKFKAVHGKIVAAMKKFGIEHGGCVICNKEPRKEASYMENTDIDNVEQTDVQEPVTHEGEASESDEVVEETQASAEETTEESEEAAGSEEEPITESTTSTDDAEPTGRISILEGEMACLKDELSKIELKYERLRQVDKAGIELTDDLESVVLALDSGMFTRFLAFLEAEQASVTSDVDESEAEPSVEESGSEEESVEPAEEPAEASGTEEPAPVDNSSEEASDPGPDMLNLESAAGSRRAYYRAIFAK